MLQTLERNVHTFDAQVLTPAGAAALAELTGPAGLPFLPPDRQRTALENGQIIADYAGQPELQAAAALMPLYDDAPLPTSLRAAGYGADGQGAVLTPPVLNENYTQLRHFLRMAHQGHLFRNQVRFECSLRHQIRLQRCQRGHSRGSGEVPF